MTRQNQHLRVSALSAVFLSVLVGRVAAQPTNNTAYGTGALQNNITGCSNSAFGFDALFSNTLACTNTAVGDSEARYASGPL